MPRVNIYLNDSDFAKWETIENKSQFVSDAINHTNTPKVMTADMDKETVTKMATAAKRIKQSGFCKNGHILNRFGVCDVKGCK